MSISHAVALDGRAGDRPGGWRRGRGHGGGGICRFGRPALAATCIWRETFDVAAAKHVGRRGADARRR